MSRLDQQLLSPSLSKNKVESKLVIRKYAKNVVHTLQNGSEEKNNQPSYQPTVVSKWVEFLLFNLFFYFSRYNSNKSKISVL